MSRLAGWVLTGLVGLAVALATAFAALAVYWSDIPGETLRTALAAGIVLATGLAFALCRHRGRVLVAYLLAFAGFAWWWSSIAPSGEKDWLPDVAVLPYADVRGDTVTIHNVRNCAYRSEFDYTPRYDDRTYDLSRLTSVDLIAVYWMGDAIAHVMVSFGFGGQDYLCFSIETRKARGQEYSSLKGFFKQYELIYIVADERDLIRLRTDFRRPPEDVYLYRINMMPGAERKFFLEYIKAINDLHAKPEFYNTLITNCTTNVVGHIQAYGGRASYNWKILLSGYAPQYAYEIGSLDASLPFAALRAKSYVNQAARAAGDAPDFSARIRRGLPGMEAVGTAGGASAAVAGSGPDGAN